MFRKKGPSSAAEWEEALKGLLTDEKVEYLKRGKPKKCDYKRLVMQIDECAVFNINVALAMFEEGCDELVESLYRLKILIDTVRNVYFFKHLGFIKKTDCESIEKRIKTAIENFVSQIKIPIDNENADLIYHISALKREAGITKAA